MAESAERFVLTLSIAAVERDTGLSKDTLRVWERRYGFPSPRRDELGERAYSLAEVDRLRIIKRLLDAGHRPGRVVPMAMDQLQTLAGQTVDQQTFDTVPVLRAAEIADHLALIRSHDVEGLQAQLTRCLARLGVFRFACDVVAPLNAAVGDAWIRGQLEVFEEHLYTEIVVRLLKGAIAAIPPPRPGGPCVLLTTFPGEPHALGLLMCEAVLALEGCRCISLGVQTPLWDITRAATAMRADVVALSFTGSLNPNRVFDSLSELRAKLPESVRIWVGGGAPVLYRRRIEGVDAFDALEALPGAVRKWSMTEPQPVSAPTA